MLRIVVFALLTYVLIMNRYYNSRIFISMADEPIDCSLFLSDLHMLRVGIELICGNE